MSDFLQSMLSSSLQRSDAAQAQRGFERLELLAADLSKPPRLQLDGRFDLIAEIKASSPAEGELADSDALDRGALAAQYQAGGAMAVSVLTEPSRFAGELDHLAQVAAVLGTSGVPAMRKDFLVSEYQILEARLSGAGGVLLIVAMLDNERLARMLKLARELGLFVLLECFDAEDISRSRVLLSTPQLAACIDAGQILLGVNTRNLRTLAVDSERLAKLAPTLPSGVVCVAESGLTCAADAARVAALGYRAGLVGTALMRSVAPAQTVREFVMAGREVCQ